ncbi:transposase [Fidelibacter multiformis]|jgi:REP element-mobilizing transposase RayT|uniref:transposase n=1 Tax=Fidelibacter multiformis TaxID=3377529 RepID=UPI0037DC88EB
MTPGNAQILIHVILPILSGKCLQAREWDLKRIIREHLETHGQQHVYTSVQSDHIHLLFFMNPHVSLSLFFKVFFRDTSREYNRQEKPDHLIWNPEYFAVSCNLDELENLVRMLETQTQYHEFQSYDDELKHLLERMLETSVVAENLETT